MLEMRRYERVSFLCQLELTALPGSVAHEARSLDLSLGGVGAITTKVYTIGQLVMVNFILNDSGLGKTTVQVLGRVAYLTADSDANRLGIQFLQSLTEAEHAPLVKKLLKA
jgi:hypothetical protein